jgi:hypothetical protein
VISWARIFFFCEIGNAGSQFHFLHGTGFPDERAATEEGTAGMSARCWLAKSDVLSVILSRGRRCVDVVVCSLL